MKCALHRAFYTDYAVSESLQRVSNYNEFSRSGAQPPAAGTSHLPGLRRPRAARPARRDTAWRLAGLTSQSVNRHPAASPSAAVGYSVLNRHPPAGCPRPPRPSARAPSCLPTAGRLAISRAVLFTRHHQQQGEIHSCHATIHVPGSACSSSQPGERPTLNSFKVSSTSCTVKESILLDYQQAAVPIQPPWHHQHEHCSGCQKNDSSTLQQCLHHHLHLPQSAQLVGCC